MQNTSIQAMRPRRRVITSCSECYRRKQKCNRVRPCNFCSTRGVPERCHYDEDSGEQPAEAFSGPAQNKDYVQQLIKRNEDSRDSILSESRISFVDQFGYSPASRRDQFQWFGEQMPNAAVVDAVGEQLVTTSNTDAYLSLVTRMPCEKTTDELIGFHFSADHWSFPILDEHYFRALRGQFRAHFDDRPPHTIVGHLSPELATFPALLFSVLASALQFVSPDATIARTLGVGTVQECDSLSQFYLDTGQDLIDLLKQPKPTTTSVEYHLIKTSWLKNCGRGNEAWQCLGVALRQAQEIDLHQVQEDDTETPDVSIEQTLLRLWELEHRKRLWARIFIMDSHMAVSLGRPRGIHREDCSTSVPVDCEYPLNPSQTVPVSTNHACKPPNSFSPLMFSIELGHKYHDMMSLRASKRDLKDYSSVQTLHSDIQSLLSKLPPALRPSFPDTRWDWQMPLLPTVRLRLLTTVNIFLLALHRPYVSTHITSRYAALSAAFAILQAQQELFISVPQAQHKLYGFSFYTIDAGIFLTAIVVKYPMSDLNVSASALQALRHAGSRLSCMKDRSNLAGTGELVLRQCCAIIETKTPLSSSIATFNGIGSQEQLTGFDNMSFLQEFDTHVPDQATHELISFLADPSTLMSISDNSTLPTDGGIDDDTELSGLNPAPLSNIGYMGMTKLDGSHWRY